MDNINFDLRKTGFLSPVQLQVLPSCYTYATSSSIEFLINKLRNANNNNNRVKVKLSEQDLFNNLVSNIDEEKCGRDSLYVYEWIRKNGVVLQRTCPNAPTREPPSPNREVIFKIGGYDWIQLSEMEHEIQKNGPVTITLRWTPQMSLFNGDGVYTGPADPSEYYGRNGKLHGLHMVEAVGYGNAMVKGKWLRYWLIKNSYGLDWGNEGYAKFSQDIRDVNGRPLINGGCVPRGIVIDELPWNGRIFDV